MQRTHLNPARRWADSVQRSAAWLFARELLRRPGAVGAVWPSSGQLARCIAAHVPQRGDGLVVELGAGTGVVTQALLQRGIACERLVVIERSQAFVEHLRHRFPTVTVLHGDATLLADLLPRDREVDAIVSSLPLRSLPAHAVAAIIEQWRVLLSARSTVVQFTYDLRADRMLPQGFRECASGIIWSNLPPARVLALQCSPEPASASASFPAGMRAAPPSLPRRRAS
jgi:phosphatidylethanolamine/phosphatidyl-N-methylethanolamine N-methyltransferase